jgi:hypothetical protein
MFIMSPSQRYRDELKWSLRAFTTHEQEAALFGDTKTSWSHMDDLEAAWELVFNINPRRIAPPDYRPRR